jgi:hypothetical protein
LSFAHHDRILLLGRALRRRGASIAGLCLERRAPERGLASPRSGGVYVFPRERPASFVIPPEADGVKALPQSLGRRGLFPPEARSGPLLATDGPLGCWPPDDESTRRG